MKKLMAVAGACLLAACSGQTVTGPDPVVVTEDAAPVAKATPAPQPVAGTPAAGSAFKLTGAKGVIYVEYAGSARTSVETYYTSFDNQSLKFAVQTHNVEPNSTLTRSFPVTTCFQGDAEQVGVKPIGGIFFDINGDPFNPTKEPAKTEACRNQCVPKLVEGYTDGEFGAWSKTGYGSEAPNCGVRTKKRYHYTVNSCTQEKREGETQVIEETKECATCEAVNPPSFQLGSLSYPTYTPKVPAVPATLYYYDGGGEFQNDCTNEGGQYFGNQDGRVNVCYTPVNHGSSWIYDTFPFVRTAERYGNNSVAEVPASGGNPISGSASVSGAAVWKLVLKATDPGNYEKATSTKTLQCGQSASLSVSYNWIGHSSDDWQLLLYRDGTLVAQSAVVNNPSN